MRITLDTTAILQVATWSGAFIAQALDSGVVPDRWKHGLIVAASVLSLILHMFAGTHNSNGTPEALPYSPHTGELLSAAEAAYEGYRAAAGGRSLATGATIPAWPALMPAIQEAWKAAAGAAQAQGLSK